MSDREATQRFSIRNIITAYCGQMLDADAVDAMCGEIDEEMSGGGTAWAFGNGVAAPSGAEIHLYQLSPEDIYAAETIGQAIDCIFQDIGQKDEDLSVLDSPCRISEEEMDEQTMWVERHPDYERETITLRQGLQELIDEGAKFPCLLCTTEY